MTNVRDTSLLSYFDLVDKGVIDAREGEIFSLLSKTPDLTDNEMVKALNYKDRNELSPARWRLLKQNILQSNGKRLCSITKRTVYQWRINKDVKVVVKQKEDNEQNIDESIKEVK